MSGMQKNMREEEAELRELQAKFRVDGEQHERAKSDAKA